MNSGKAKLKVFVVEDEAIIAMMLEDMLIDLGHEVAATAGRLDRAMMLAADLPLDLAIVDVNLNGEETYPLAALLTARGVSVIFSTGYGSAGIKEEWKGVPLLQKPFEERNLAAAISRVTQSKPLPV